MKIAVIILDLTAKLANKKGVTNKKGIINK